MSQEINSGQPTGNMGQQPTPKKKKTWIYLGIIALLLGVNIYLFTSKNRIAEERDEAYTARETVVEERDYLNASYDAALVRLDMLITKNTELDSLLNNKDSELSKMKQEISRILSDSRATADDLARARQLIASLNGKAKSYEERIAELELDNSRLSGLNEVLSEERDATVADNIYLQQKIRLGTVLHASRIRMTPIALLRSGKKEKTTEKANRVDILRVSFDIDENRIAEDGIKDIFLCITAPDGKLLSNAAYGSGVTETYDGKPLNYTMAKQVDLNQGKPVKDITVDWHQDNDYERGEYQISLYHDGYLIGSGNIRLR